MGFEEDFERGVRDGKWTKPLMDFKDNKPATEIAAKIEKAISHDVRKGLFPVIRPFVDLFDAAYQRMADTRQLRLDIPGSGYDEMLAGFEASCKGELASINHHPLAEQFVERAAVWLEAGCTNHELFKENHQAADTRLVTEFLASHVQGKLEPALRLGIARNSETPLAAEARRASVMNDVRLGPLADKLIAGQNARVKAPGRRRPSLDTMMNESIL